MTHVNLDEHYLSGRLHVRYCVALRLVDLVGGRVIVYESPLTQNPHPPGSVAAASWDRGWQEGLEATFPRVTPS